MKPFQNRMLPIGFATIVIAISNLAAVQAASAAELSQSQLNAAAGVVTSQDCGKGISAINITPPAGFDPLTASGAELAANNFPAKPVSGSAADLAMWTHYVTSPIHRDSACVHLQPLASSPHNMLASSTTSTLPGLHTQSLVGNVRSPNWAGYVVNQHTYTDVQAQWRVPGGKGNGTAYAYSSSWVGVNSPPTADARHPILQAGSESDGDSGVAHHWYLWWEVWPEFAQKDVDKLFASGDLLSVHVTGATNSASFHIDDLTAGFNQTYHYSGTFTLDGHAEWILERTQIDGNLPLLSQATTTFTNASAGGSGTSGWQAVGNLPYSAVFMYSCDLTVHLASPSGIAGGNSFTASWQNFGGGYPDRNC